jgi:hypothetical protein
VNGLKEKTHCCYNCAKLFTDHRSLLLLCCAISVCLLALSGLSCITYDSGPIAGHAWPKTEHESRSFVTPECPLITELLQGILGDAPYEPSRDGFDRVRNWVANNVEYQTDEARVGKDDEWQTPREILLDPRVGDCEDFSLLLCSLLRSYGIGSGRVFVAIGVDRRDNAHAFLIENWYLDGEWRVIEPQATADHRHGLFWWRSVDSGLEKYEIILAFNDVHYYEGSFPWDGGQADSLTVSGFLEAAGNAVRRASQLLGYLLGFLADHETESF